jgi:pilus assembly protein CpaB
MRAVAIRVNEVVGVSGFIAPGTRVDVLIAGVPPGGSGGGTVSKTLLQNMEVLSAGTNIQKDAEGKPVQVAVVNLLATPEQAEALSLASNEMRIQFVLRNPVDKEISKTPGTTVANLFTGESGVQMPAAPAPKSKRTPAPQVVKAAPPPPPPPPVLEKVQVPIVVEVIHGTKKTETAFKPSDGEKQ